MADDTGLFGMFERQQLMRFVAVEIGLVGGGQLRLLDGSGQVSFGGRTFISKDPEFGVLSSLEAITDGFGDEAPSMRIGINPPTASAAAILAAQDMQGKTVLVWLGSVTHATGAVDPDPLLIFAGEVDVAQLSVAMGSRSLVLDCVSVWERLFEDAEGVRLTNSFHQLAWPGELGFEFVTDVTRQLPWGSDTPRPQVIADAIYRRPTS
jgi:hypothetical protein